MASVFNINLSRAAVVQNNFPVIKMWEFNSAIE